MKKIPGTVAQVNTPGLETRLNIPIVIAYMGKDLRIGFQYFMTVGMMIGGRRAMANGGRHPWGLFSPGCGIIHQLQRTTKGES
jgi:hypothetical protein